MKISKLKNNPNNPRFIKDDKFEKLKKSISEFPEMMEKRPIVCVTDADGKLYPLGGNMRLKALQELGYKEITDSWIHMADEWTEDQRREFVIKDNAGGRMLFDKEKRYLNSQEYILCGSYPLDYNFKNVEPKYLIGMSVPPVMTAQIANQIRLQWLDKIK